MSEPTFRESLKGELVAIASRILEEEGLEAVQARRVAREAGCAVGTIYNVFRDIDDLMIAVNTATLAMLGEAVRTAAEAERHTASTVRGRLVVLALAYVRFAREHHRRWDAVFRHKLRPGKEVPEAYVADQERLIAIIEEAIGDEVTEPTARSQTARALFGAVHGIVALALDGRLGGSIGDRLEDHVRLILDLTARGIEEKARGT